MEQFNGKQIKDETQVPVHLHTVKDRKQLCETRDDRSIIEKLINASVEADREFDKLHRKSESKTSKQIRQEKEKTAIKKEIILPLR